MKLVKIYRLEDVFGYGPYNSKFDDYNYHNKSKKIIAIKKIIRQLANEHNSYDDEHPTGSADIINYNSKLRYACNDIRTLKKWFGPFLKKFIKSGLFHVKELTLPSNAVFDSNSKKQIGYIKNKVIMKKVINI